MHWKHYWEVSWEKQFEMGCKWSNLTAVKTQLHSFRKAEHMCIRYHLIAHVKWGWLAYTTSTVRDMMMIRTVNECMNCGERYEFMVDHGSYTRKLRSCEIKAWKKIQAWTGFEPMTSAIPVQCFTNWAIKSSGSWSLCECMIYPYTVKDANDAIHIFLCSSNIWSFIHSFASFILGIPLFSISYKYSFKYWALQKQWHLAKITI